MSPKGKGSPGKGSRPPEAGDRRGGNAGSPSKGGRRRWYRLSGGGAEFFL